ncbi:YHYH domain-containing protein [Trabulsiella guamensis]|nr:YHYH domain-containing protein [Trabulsiella guamensis]
MKIRICKIILSLSILLFTGLSYAHSGGTNSEGCHTQKSTGEYHCHNRK